MSSPAAWLEKFGHGITAVPLGDRVFVVASWIACVVALGLVIRRPVAFSLTSSAYGTRLLRSWRIVTFVLSAAVFTFGAPYMGDPTWDRAVGALMSGFTYLLAPWSVGTLYRFVRRRASATSALVAIAGWLLATSSSYETYLLFRDGRLPPTTFSNLVASSTAFFAAGLFWSLTYVAGRGVVFAFMQEEWPKGEEERRIAPGMVLVALLFAAIVLLLLVPFVCVRTQ